ncbi:hypothetical protein B5F74_01630 [Collinsella sp. An271]|nr:hypothetical protein B5F74_01630 [Collinsella sp. An271]
MLLKGGCGRNPGAPGRKGTAMFTPEEREAALELYDRLGSVPAVVAELGYPSERCLYGWIARRDGACARPRAVRYPAQEKAAAARRVLSGESCAAVAADVGASASAVLRWRDAYAEGGIGALMAKGDVVAPGPRADAGALPDDAGELKRMVLELQLENDLMRQVVELVKKDPCVDPTRLSNREKARVIDAMRGTYSLSCLASRLGIAASSYHYARAAAAAPDKWAEARAAVVEEFEGAGRSRGYRYVVTANLRFAV